MSFGVRNEDSGLEYCSKGAKGFFAQKRRLVDWNQWRLYRGIKAFFAKALDSLSRGELTNQTLGEFAKQQRVPQEVLNDFVIPMAAAIWSMPPAGILEFPAKPLLRFMENHRMLGIGIQYEWRTVKGGSEQYKRKLIGKLPNPPRPNFGAKEVLLSGQNATVVFEDDSQEAFDHVIIATHADDALKLLANPTSEQRNLLASFQYNTNNAILHSDSSVMPKSKAAWASWNVSHRQEDSTRRSATHYWMNILQKIDTKQNYFVSVDAYQSISAETIHWQKAYTHPRFDSKAINAQAKLPLLNESGSVSFCGSYFRNGFHEDALWSSLQVVKTLLKRKEIRRELLPI